MLFIPFSNFSSAKEKTWVFPFGRCSICIKHHLFNHFEPICLLYVHVNSYNNRAFFPSSHSTTSTPRAFSK